MYRIILYFTILYCTVDRLLCLLYYFCHCPKKNSSIALFLTVCHHYHWWILLWHRFFTIFSIFQHWYAYDEDQTCTTNAFQHWYISLFQIILKGELHNHICRINVFFKNKYRDDYYCKLWRHICCAKRHNNIQNVSNFWIYKQLTEMFTLTIS